jgi:hypothetical protein
MTATTANPYPQWWLLQGSSATGPFRLSDVFNMLRDGRLSLESVACPVGSKEWRTLRDWNFYASPNSSVPVAESSPKIQLQLPPLDTETNAQARDASLPDMARWIGIYGLFVSPTLWLVNKLTCLVTAPVFVEESPLFGLEVLFYLIDSAVSLSATVLLFLGALFLRNRKQVATTLLVTGLGIGIAWLFVGLVVLALMLAAAASEPGVQHLNTSDEGAGIGLVLLGIALAATVFEVTALVWLLINRQQIHDLS